MGNSSKRPRPFAHPHEVADDGEPIVDSGVPYTSSATINPIRDFVSTGRSLGKAVPKETWGLRDREAAEVDRAAGRLPPERFADLPYRGGGPVAPQDFRRVFTAGYWVGWKMSLPTWENPYRPETPYGRVWLDGYGAGRRVALAQQGPQKAVGGG